MEQTWKILETKNNPRGRHETSFVECDGQYYLIGGREAEGLIERFNPKTLTWESMTAKSPLIHHFQPIAHKGKILMVGAMTGNYPDEPALLKVQIYDPSKDQWSEGDTIPSHRRRGSSGGVLYNGKIYLAGGIILGHTSGTNAWFDSYDPDTGEWEELSDAPRIRDHFHALVLNDKLYCIGGRNTSYHEEDNFKAFNAAVIREIDVYDFKTGEWTTLPEESSLPFGSAAAGTAVLNGKIVYFGGENHEKAMSNTQIFDPETAKWTQGAEMIQGRHGSQAAIMNGALAIAAGSPVLGGGNLNNIEVYS